MFSFLMNGQEPVFIHLSEKNGLPDKEFYNLIEDDKGFIWLAADNGLYRYDGKSYKSFSNKKQRSRSVFGVKQDDLGRIWCNNISGQFFFTKNNELHLFTDLSKLLKGELSEFMVVKKFLWVFSARNIYKINIETKLIENIHTNNKNFGNPLKLDKTIYFGNVDSIISLTNKNYFKAIAANNLPTKDHKGKTITQGPSKIFKIVSSLFLYQNRLGINKFYKINSLDKNIIPVKGSKPIAKERIHTEFENENDIWFGTNSGVWIFEFKENRFRFKKRFLKDKSVTKIIKDKDDNYWFTTLNDGIYVAPNIAIEVATVSEKNKNISSLDIINKNTLVFGSKAGDIGFYNIQKDKEHFIDIPTKDRVSVLKNHPEKSTVYISKDIQSFTYNYKTFQLKEIKQVSKISTAKSLLILNKKDVFFTSYNTVKILKNGSFKNEIVISNNKRTYASLKDESKKEVYVAFVDNLVKYNHTWESKIIKYNNKPIYGRSLTKTKDGVIWVSSINNGIYGIKNDSVIHHYNTSNGLTSNNTGIIKGDQNNLWISSENSFQLLDVVSKKIKTLTKREGILSYDITGIEILNNKVFLSSNEGLFSLNKENLFKEQYPEIYFNELEINEKDTVVGSNYRLNYNQNAIKIGFNVNGFLYNQKSNYKYRLKGLSDTWLFTDKNINSVKYNSLPAGKYTFQVQPNLENSSPKNIKELTFSIQRPYWKTWWFILGVSLLFFGSMNYYFRRKIKGKEKERIAQLEKVSLEKELITTNLTALRSQMNPHFIFNALNSIQDLVLKHDTDATYDSIVLFSVLIRNALSYSNQDFISIQEELNFLKVYLKLENLRFGEDFIYTISYNSEENLEIPSLLIQPFIENALVHGLLHKSGKKELDIEFVFSNNSLQCIITDNGVGREKAKEITSRQGHHHESFALGAIEKRLDIFRKQYAQEIGYTIEDLYEGEVAKGTKVIVNLPFI
ncbi:histidine kinase [Lutibacter sp. Hel_I_33_5]|uniref:sensor histidine kinase n=1 Tax=Lutibacter sp. Hel_I_33_5 TaxID=1566289 RepID=UPI00164436EC|nr:histidine kinase [Lutibacter sp. Hel_I_33_5]